MMPDLRRKKGDEVDQLGSQILTELLVPLGWEEDDTGIWTYRDSQRTRRVILSFYANTETSIRLVHSFSAPADDTNPGIRATFEVDLADPSFQEKILAWLEQVADGF